MVDMVGELACIFSKNIGDSISTLASDGLIINFPREQTSHENSLV